MTLLEHYREIQSLIESDPANGQRLVIIAKDTEGNSYSPMSSPFTLGLTQVSVGRPWVAEWVDDASHADEEYQALTESPNSQPGICLWPTN